MGSSISLPPDFPVGGEDWVLANSRRDSQRTGVGHPANLDVQSLVFS
jgi:hypothetical protein